MPSRDAARPEPDPLIVELARYALGDDAGGPAARRAARDVLVDALGCALEALDYPACTRLLGPIVPGTVVPDGARVPGTGHRTDPVQAAFELGTLIRWLDFNDTWLAAEWGHPSDNLGGILMVADWLSRTALAQGREPLRMRAVIDATIRAHEIQGVLALRNAFNAVGLDHVILVKVATTAVACRLLGLTQERTVAAISHAWVDGHPLRTYRHAPNAGSRKSWAAGDATARGVRLALIARTGETACPSALTAPTWGFQDALFRGRTVELARTPGSHVIENVLFKISYPAEFHAQTAVEAAMRLHDELARAGRGAADVARVTIRTHAACLRIIDKHGPLANPADRDHCIQYMVAVPLLHGRLTAADYEDGVAADPRIDALRERIVCVEDPAFSRDYLDPERRSIANGLTVELHDGTRLPEVVVEYPIGHPRRRDEGRPLLEAKFRRNLERRFDAPRRRAIVEATADVDALEAMPVPSFVDLFVPEGRP